MRERGAILPPAVSSRKVFLDEFIDHRVGHTVSVEDWYGNEKPRRPRNQDSLRVALLSAILRLMMHPPILLVHGAAIGDAIQRDLAGAAFPVTRAVSTDAALSILRQDTFPVIVLDSGVSDFKKFLLSVKFDLSQTEARIIAAVDTREASFESQRLRLRSFGVDAAFDPFDEHPLNPRTVVPRWLTDFILLGTVSGKEADKRGVVMVTDALGYAERLRFLEGKRPLRERLQ